MSSLTRSECFFIHYAYTSTRRFTRLKRRFLKKEAICSQTPFRSFLAFERFKRGEGTKGRLKWVGVCALTEYGLSSFC